MVFWERGLAPWDVAGALAILSEAKGKFTRIDGKPYQFGDESIVASNGKLHKGLVEVLN